MSHYPAEKMLERLRRKNPSAGHLDECPACADGMAALKELDNLLAGARFLGEAPPQDCYSTHELAEYMEFRGADRQAVKAHLAECDRCFAATAYYFAESHAMKVAPEGPTPAEFRAAALALVPRSDWKRRWVYAPLPAYLAAAALWLVFIFTPSSPVVVLTRETPFYSIFEKKREAMPYFYFTGDGRKVGSEVAGMRIVSGRSAVSFRWNPMPGATEYYFMLQEIRDGAPHRVREMFVKTPRYQVDSADLRKGLSYRWIVAGLLSEDRFFQGTMEFKVE